MPPRSSAISCPRASHSQARSERSGAAVMTSSRAQPLGSDTGTLMRALRLQDPLVQEGRAPVPELRQAALVRAAQRAEVALRPQIVTSCTGLDLRARRARHDERREAAT